MKNNTYDILSNLYEWKYIKFRNMILFFNPDDNSFDYASNLIKDGYRVHIFMTSEYFTNKYLKDFINTINAKCKIFVHVPKKLINLKSIINDIIKDFPKVKLISEKHGETFYMDNCYLDLEVKYEKEFIKINLNMDTILYDTNSMLVKFKYKEM